MNRDVDLVFLYGLSHCHASFCIPALSGERHSWEDGRDFMHYFKEQKEIVLRMMLPQPPPTAAGGFGFSTVGRGWGAVSALGGGESLKLLRPRHHE